MDVKAEKANAMMRYNRLSYVTNLFRFLEICVALIVFSWFSTKLPLTIRVFSHYLGEFSIILVSPRFMFIIGNAIVITLFVKSGQISGESSSGNSSTTDLYDEFVKKSVNRPDISPPIPEVPIIEQNSNLKTVLPEVNVYQDKEIVSEKQTSRPNPPDKKKKYERSQSENMKKKPKRELRKSRTDKCCEQEMSSECEQEMSSEEFQRRIEGFIAKQIKFHRQESMAIVLQNYSVQPKH